MTVEAPRVGQYVIEQLTVSVYALGNWTAYASFADFPVELTDPVTIEAGGIQLVGRVAPDADGTHGERRSCRIDGGVGDLTRVLPAKDYSSDAGIRTRTILDDLARETGSVLGSFSPPSERVGTHFARLQQAASTTLDQAVGGQWWIGFDGRLNVGMRPSNTLAADVLDYRPEHRALMLALDTLVGLDVGVTITSPALDSPLGVEGFDIRADSAGLRADCLVAESQPNDLRELISQLVRAEVAQLHQPIRRYRVLEQQGDRLSLQPVRRDLGLPTLSPISVMCSAGMRTQVQVGSHVLVGFIDGVPTEPVVIAYAGPDGVGFEPEHLTIGGMTGAAAARLGDSVEVGGTGATIVLTPVTPAPGPVTPGTPYLVSFASTAQPQAALAGKIISGSSLVEIA